jgi:hypothetical protein
MGVFVFFLGGGVGAVVAAHDGSVNRRNGSASLSRKYSHLHVLPTVVAGSPLLQANVDLSARKCSLPTRTQYRMKSNAKSFQSFPFHNKHSARELHRLEPKPFKSREPSPWILGAVPPCAAVRVPAYVPSQCYDTLIVTWTL